VDAAVSETIGLTYRQLALFDAAEKHLSKSLQIRRTLPGDHQSEIVNGLLSLAVLQRQRGNYAESDSLCRQALAAQEKLQPRDDIDVALAQSALANTLYAEAKFHDAEHLYAKAIASLRAAGGARAKENLPLALEGLAILLNRQSDYPAAEKALR